jgi:hypothetical protein
VADNLLRSLIDFMLTTMFLRQCGRRSESFCTVFRKEMSNSVGASRERCPSNQAACLLGKIALTKCLTFVDRVSTGILTRVTDRWKAPRQGRLHRCEEGNEMHPENLMKPNLFSEIILVVSSELVFASLLLIVLTTLTRA